MTSETGQAPCYQRGLKAWRRGYYQTAVQSWRRGTFSSKSYDSQMCALQLWTAYRTGTGVPKNMTEAKQWLAKVNPSFVILPPSIPRFLMEARFPATPRSGFQAWKRIFEKRPGYENEAAAYLADAYERGLGVAKDLKKSFRYREFAGLSDDPISLLKLGLAYWKGMGVKKDGLKAAYWLRRYIDWELPNRRAKLTPDQQNLKFAYELIRKIEHLIFKDMCHGRRLRIGSRLR